MHLRTYLATTRRILTQLRADRRTVGLIAIVPAALLTLLYFVYRDYPGADLLFNHIAVSMMAILPTTVMFLVTSVAMLRERVKWDPGAAVDHPDPPGRPPVRLCHRLCR